MNRHVDILIGGVPDGFRSQDHGAVILILPQGQEVSADQVELCDEIYQIDFSAHLLWLLQEIHNTYPEARILDDGLNSSDSIRRL